MLGRRFFPSKMVPFQGTFVHFTKSSQTRKENQEMVWWIDLFPNTLWIKTFVEMIHQNDHIRKCVFHQVWSHLFPATPSNHPTTKRTVFGAAGALSFHRNWTKTGSTMRRIWLVCSFHSLGREENEDWRSPVQGSWWITNPNFMAFYKGIPSELPCICQLSCGW